MKAAADQWASSKPDSVTLCNTVQERGAVPARDNLQLLPIFDERVILYLERPVFPAVLYSCTLQNETRYGEE